MAAKKKAKKPAASKPSAVSRGLTRVVTLPWMLVALIIRLLVMGVQANPSFSRRVAGMALLSVVLLGWFYFVRLSVVQDPRYQVVASEITVGSLPDIFSENCARTFVLSDLDGQKLTIFDRDLSVKIVNSAKKVPWVRHARVVGRTLPNSVELKLTPHWPRLLVQKEFTLSPVDDKGFLLDSSFYNMEILRKTLPKVVGLNQEPPVAAGMPWVHDGIFAALELVQLIEERRAQHPDLYRNFHIATVNVKNIHGMHSGAPEIITGIATQHTLGASEVEVKWSWCPGKLKPGYRSLAEQVKSLEKNLAKVDGMFRAYRAGFAIDVRFPKTYAQLR